MNEGCQVSQSENKIYVTTKPKKKEEEDKKRGTPKKEDLAILRKCPASQKKKWRKQAKRRE